MNEFLTFAFWAPGPFEWVVIAIFAVILFGKRLPEIGRSLGRGLVEFKRGLSEMKDEIDTAGEKPEKSDETPENKEPAEKDTGSKE